MKLVASLPCLKNIVGLVGVNHPISPAVLPSEAAKLSPIVFRGLVAETADIKPGAGVDGDASKIIDGVGMPKDNISVSVCVLLSAVHSVAVAVDEGEVATLVNPTD